VVSVVAFSKVEQQFFPSSNRPELLLSMTLPHRASIRATISEVDRLEKLLIHDPDIAYHSFYIAYFPRFSDVISEQFLAVERPAIADARLARR
jgi:multidrug efflux pump subunit AcrB